MIQTLTPLFAAMLAAEQLLKQRKNQPSPFAPEMPKTISSDEEWAVYQRALEEYNKKCWQQSNGLHEADAMLKSAKKNFIQQIPAHTWFKLEYDGKSYWVGVENNDWPMSDPDLFIKDGTIAESELQTLKFRHINSN
jgi:hypothetical protein